MRANRSERAVRVRLTRLPTGEPEVFASVQGEGVTCGLPSVFVRLAFCNLSCEWCDSRFSWDWSRYDPRADTLSLASAEIAARVRERAARAIGNVVFTGGEPMLQQDALEGLAGVLKGDGYRLEVETNGTVPPTPELAALIDQWNVSPKTESSGNRHEDREVPEALEWFGREDTAYWKFVVLTPDDMGEILALVDRYRVPSRRVVLMPEGTDAETLHERSRWLAELCERHGFRLGTRLHIHLWGTERGT